MSKTTDIRITKTQRAIQSSFIKLMNEVGFSNITVKDIVKNAEINRSTFYAHYLDKFDLLDKIEDKVLEDFSTFEEYINPSLIFADSESEELQNAVKLLTDFIQRNGKLMAVLFSEKGNPGFVHKLGEMIKNIWIEKAIINNLTVPQNYAMASIIGVLENIMTEWVNNDLQETSEEFARIAIKIIRTLAIGLTEPTSSLGRGG